MMLLPNGKVIAEGGVAGSNDTTSRQWYELTPNAQGSYINGTWSQIASMHVPRLFFASNILPNGNVLVLGGEYAGNSSGPSQVNSSTSSGITPTGEIYDPATNQWTNITPSPTGYFGDDPTEVLDDGTVLAGNLFAAQTYLYNPAADPALGGAGPAWTPTTGSMLDGDRGDEENWVKLSNGNILAYSLWTGTPEAQMYVQSSGTWVPAGTVPVSLSSSQYELGPAFLLPSGKVIQFGAAGNSAVYDPTTNTWAAGPNNPLGYGMDDAPGAMMPNGDVLTIADEGNTGSSASDHYVPPSGIFLYDPNDLTEGPTGTITQLNPPKPLATDLQNNPAFIMRMLMLPTGDVLISDGTSDTLWDYNPNGAVNPAWAPTIASITGSGTALAPATLTGTQLTGISEGAAYGDDAEMSTNYPIVQLDVGRRERLLRDHLELEHLRSGHRQRHLNTVRAAHPWRHANSQRQLRLDCQRQRHFINGL